MEVEQEERVGWILGLDSATKLGFQLGHGFGSLAVGFAVGTHGENEERTGVAIDFKG